MQEHLMLYILCYMYTIFTNIADFEVYNINSLNSLNFDLEHDDSSVLRGRPMFSPSFRVLSLPLRDDPPPTPPTFIKDVISLVQRGRTFGMLSFRLLGHAMLGISWQRGLHRSVPPCLRTDPLSICSDPPPKTDRSLLAPRRASF